MRQQLWVIVALGGVVMVGAGCGSGEGETSPTGTTISPLSALLGYQNETPEEQRQKQLEVENLTAECMREEGWEYQPVDWAAQQPSQQQPDEEWGSDSFGKKYGYGVVYNYEQWEEPQLLNGGETPEDQQFVDPNQEYVDSLSENEREEYYATLYGEQTEATMMAGSDAESTDDTVTSGTASANSAYVPSGCNSIASEQVYASQDPTRDNPDLQDRLTEYYENQQDDPKIQAANEQWVECITDELGDIEVNGGPVKQNWDMYQYVDQLKYEAMGLEFVEWDGEEQIDDMYSGFTNEDGAGYAYVGTAEAIPEADLEELRQRELEVWAKDNGCQKKARIKEIQIEAERAFVEQLRSEFPELGPGS